MAEHGPLAAKFADAGARMMAGDRSSFGAVFAPEAVWQVNGRTIAEGRDNIVNAVTDLP